MHGGIDVCMEGLMCAWRDGCVHGGIDVYMEGSMCA